MDSHVKMGLIIGAAIIIATGMWIYFGQFQTCVRAQTTYFILLDGDASPEFLRRAAQRRCSGV